METVKEINRVVDGIVYKKSLARKFLGVHIGTKKEDFIFDADPSHEIGIMDPGFTITHKSGIHRIHLDIYLNCFPYVEETEKIGILEWAANIGNKISASENIAFTTIIGGCIGNTRLYDFGSAVRFLQGDGDLDKSTKICSHKMFDVIKSVGCVGECIASEYVPDAVILCFTPKTNGFKNGVFGLAPYPEDLVESSGFVGVRHNYGMFVDYTCTNPMRVVITDFEDKFVNGEWAQN